jgi:hypothetical protein
MKSVTPNADRLITLLCTQPRWSVCDECLSQELAIELADLRKAIAELRADNIVRLIPGVCFMCQRSVTVLSMVTFGMSA